MRLGQILWRGRLSRWEREGLEERCEGWWPSLAAFVAEQLGGTRWPLPEEALDVQERFALIEDDGGVFVSSSSRRFGHPAPSLAGCADEVSSARLGEVDALEHQHQLGDDGAT